MKSVAATTALLLLAVGGCAVDLPTSSTAQHAIGTSVATDKPTYTPGEPVAVTFAGFPASGSDWLAVASASAPDTDYIAWTYVEGTDGAFVFQTQLPPGDYEARGYFDYQATQSFAVEARAAFTVAVSTAPTVTTDATLYASAATVTVNYTGLAGSTANWIGIALPGSTPDQFVRFAYTNGATSGSVQFTNLPDGAYIARSFNDEAYVVVAQSAEFAVGNALDTADTFDTNEAIVVDFRGLPPSPLNWIGLYPAGAANTAFVNYRYVETASGQATFGGLADGNYEVRAFLNDSFDVYATASFTVAPPPQTTPSIATNKALYASGESVIVTYAGSTSSADWIGISAAGSASSSYVAWSYLDASGTQTFNGLAPGNYEARFYRDDSYDIGASATFTINAPPPPSALDPVTLKLNQPRYNNRQIILVSYTNLGGPTDWISIAVAGSPDVEFITFQYVNTDEDGSVLFGSLPVGTYEVRAMRNDSSVVETRVTFNVLASGPTP